MPNDTPKRRLKPVGESLPVVDQRAATPATVEQREVEQQKNAESSPLALTFQLVSCAFASHSFEEGKVIPTYTFHPPCIRGYARPNQDCRTCAHVRLIPVGEHQGAFAHRYHGHGMVIPISEETADRVMDTVEEEGAQALTNPSWASYFAELEAKQQAEREAAERARDLEERQRGGRLVRRAQGPSNS